LVENLSITKVGASIWVGFANDLYSELSHVCREYITNAIDAKSDKITLDIYPPYNQLQIVDNGEGMSESELREKLITVGLSERTDIEETIGRFGIGIYAGTSICNEIEIVTKSKNSRNEGIVTLPVGKWQELASDNPNQELTQLTQFTFQIVRSEHDENSSFTRITLKGLKQFIKDELFSSNGSGFSNFRKQLQNILPLDFPSEVATEFHEMSENIQNKISNDSDFPKVQIIFNGEQLYKLHQDDLSVDPNYFRDYEIKDNEGNVIAFGWITANSKSKALDEINLRGIQLRKKNIVVIDREKWFAYLDKIGKSLRVQVRLRFSGEFYIIDDKIQPTQGRNDFSDSELVRILKDQIADRTVEYTNLIHTRDYDSKKAKTKREKSEITRRTKKIIASREETQNELGEWVKIGREKKKKQKKREKIDELNAPLNMDEVIRPVLEEAGKMQNAYMLIFIIENTVRRFMDLVAKIETGAPFNSSNPKLAINAKIKQSIGNVKKLRADSVWNDKSQFPSDLYFTNTDHLTTLISANHSMFLKYCPQINDLINLVNRMEDLRNFVMHNNLGLPIKVVSELETISSNVRVVLKDSFIKLTELMNQG